MRNTKINMKKQTKSAEIVTNKEEKDWKYLRKIELSIGRSRSKTKRKMKKQDFMKYKWRMKDIMLISTVMMPWSHFKRKRLSSIFRS